MAYTLSTVKIRNTQFVERVRNALNQNQTVTYTFTIAAAGDLANGVVGTLAATVASTFLPVEVGAVGTSTNITPETVSN